MLLSTGNSNGPSPNTAPAPVSVPTALFLLTPNQVDCVDAADQYVLLFSSLFFILSPIKASWLLARFAILQMELTGFMKC